MQELGQRQLAKCVGYGALRMATESSLPGGTPKAPQGGSGGVNLTGYIETEKERITVALKEEALETMAVQWP